ncbi:MAG TPA: FAD-binding oxidoreductase [Jiangellaceae bacterium]
MTDLETRALDSLRTTVAGDVIVPNDAGYDEARTLFNAMIDRRPAVIVACEGVPDVVSSIAFARENDLEIGVRGGGHGVAGTALSEGGLVVDLRRMNHVSVDPDARRAVVGGGATMSHLDRACQPHGLATTGGRVSTTGVGGFTLGGGTGWFDRKFGLACDNLLDAEVVMADGRVVRAAEDEDADLFWALHGGGGNFGVVTSLTLRLHPMATTTLGMLLFPPERGPEITRTYRDVLLGGPDELGGGLIYLTGPEGEDFVPEDLVNHLTLAVVVAYAGPEEEARRAAAPFIDLQPAGQMVEEMPYADLQCALDDPPGYRNYWSAEHLDAFPDAAVEAFCARAPDMIVPSASQHVLFPMGGATARGDGDYPIPWRRSAWVVHPFGLWSDPADDEQAIRWTRDVRADVHPWATGAVYLNFIGDEGTERIVAGLGQDNYDRLAAIKAEYDPENVFHLNHNIAPIHREPSTT